MVRFFPWSLARLAIFAYHFILMGQLEYENSDAANIARERIPSSLNGTTTCQELGTRRITNLTIKTHCRVPGFPGLVIETWDFAL